MKKTLLVQIYPGKPNPSHVGQNWRPWINTEPEKRQETVGLAAHRWMRERGGVQPGETLEFTVYHCWADDDPKDKDGRPVICEGTTYKCTR